MIGVGWLGCGGEPEELPVCSKDAARVCFDLYCDNVAMRCSWEGFVVEDPDACPDACILRGQLIGELCEAGVEEEVEQIEAEIVCVELEGV
jgi:hypothetical protein